MPRPPQETPLKAVCSVSELARRCGFSRSRWYDLVRDGVMPQPVYCTRTRRPLYTRELQEMALRVRANNTGIDGRYVVFYEQSAERSPPANRPGSPRRAARRHEDQHVGEMVESLRTLLPQIDEVQIRAGIAQSYPSGVPEGRYEEAVTNVFRRLRRSNGG